MVYKVPPFHFGVRSVRRKVYKYIVNELPQTQHDALYPQLPFKTRSKSWKMGVAYDNNPAGQLVNKSFAVTNLFRDERIVLNLNKATEIRPHVERLIVEAMRHGDKHRPTMALAKFWLREPNLVYKLFNVFVPRYSNYSSAFTALHMLGRDHASFNVTLTDLKAKRIPSPFKLGDAVLEMRGNSLPPIIRPKLNEACLLTNVLIDSARTSHRKKKADSQQQIESSARETTIN